MATKFYNPMSNGPSASVNGINGVNGHANDATEGTSSASLNIFIVGAGIGGLTAAIGLRRNGHNVSVSKIERNSRLEIC
jgi:NADH dehydrogenase FAD-containing subunit